MAAMVIVKTVMIVERVSNITHCTLELNIVDNR